MPLKNARDEVLVLTWKKHYCKSPDLPDMVIVFRTNFNAREIPPVTPENGCAYRRAGDKKSYFKKKDS